jgi:hypothetical protein
MLSLTFTVMAMIGYLGIPTLAAYGHRLPPGWRLAVMVGGWLWFLTYTLLTIHVTQVYYHPKG